MHRNAPICVSHNKVPAADIAHCVPLGGVNGFELREELLLAGLLRLRLFKRLLGLRDHPLLPQPLGLRNNPRQRSVDLSNLGGDGGALSVLVLVHRLAADLAVQVPEDTLNLVPELFFEVILTPLRLGQRAECSQSVGVVLVVTHTHVKFSLLKKLIRTEPAAEIICAVFIPVKLVSLRLLFGWLVVKKNKKLKLKEKKKTRTPSL